MSVTYLWVLLATVLIDLLQTEERCIYDTVSYIYDRFVKLSNLRHLSKLRNVAAIFMAPQIDRGARSFDSNRIPPSTSNATGYRRKEQSLGDKFLLRRCNCHFIKPQVLRPQEEERRLLAHIMSY
ncbi:hypothetical protein ACTXT7_001761 [Hymenolepis weldensis]